MKMLKTALLFLLLAAGVNAFAQQEPRAADTSGFRMLDSADADNIPVETMDMSESDIDTSAMTMTEEELEDMSQEDRMRYGYIEHSLYDRQPIDGFDESAQMRLTPRHPDSAAMAKLRGAEEFKYPPYKPSNSKTPGWIRAIGGWASQHLFGIRNLMFIAFGLLLIVSIVLFMNKNDIPVFRWRSRKVKQHIQAEEAVPASDLEALALAARNAGQLREAVRLRYLHTLQLLEKRGLIARSKDKTNMDYLRELGRTTYHAAFSVITLQYEYVWYGKMPLSEAQFWRVNESFDDFKKSLSQ
ncbi:DUF4129 domain-containing protein [Chitinophaga pollutisoli]|uniref:DUF4129 domain-containing protein n=1 Tax=Chitinophaga pollutisoli TaxID=3133966 RepID=A0ABZ2YWC3_9BACT